MAGKHPARIFRRRRADLIEFLHVAGIEFQGDGGKVLIELLDALRADDDAGDERLGENIGERHGCDVAAVLLGNLAHDGNAGPGLILVHRRKIEASAAAFAVAGRARTVFAREQAAGKLSLIHI